MGLAQGEAHVDCQWNHFRFLISLFFLCASLGLVNFDTHPVYLLAPVTGLCTCISEGDAGTLVATDSTILPLSLCFWGQPVIIPHLGDSYSP